MRTATISTLSAAIFYSGHSQGFLPDIGQDDVEPGACESPGQREANAAHGSRDSPPSYPRSVPLPTLPRPARRCVTELPLRQVTAQPAHIHAPGFTAPNRTENQICAAVSTSGSSTAIPKVDNSGTRTRTGLIRARRVRSISRATTRA